MSASTRHAQLESQPREAADRQKLLLIVLAVVVLIGLITAVLLHRPESSLSPAQQQTMDRLHSIVAYSGGDWNKVKPEDKQFFISGPGSGNAGSAQVVYGGLAAQMKPSK